MALTATSRLPPCFRDEDSRADRSPGEFYQLDLEMSFVEQQDVFDAVEPVIRGVFEEFSNKVVDQEFVQIPYADSLLKYGNDKPDLRVPFEICDVTDIFRDLILPFLPKTLKRGRSCARCLAQNVGAARLPIE